MTENQGVQLIAGIISALNAHYRTAQPEQFLSKYISISLADMKSAAAQIPHTQAQAIIDEIATASQAKPAQGIVESQGAIQLPTNTSGNKLIDRFQQQAEFSHEFGPEFQAVSSKETPQPTILIICKEDITRQLEKIEEALQGFGGLSPQGDRKLGQIVSSIGLIRRTLNTACTAGD